MATPNCCRQAVNVLEDVFGVSQRRACKGRSEVVDSLENGDALAMRHEP